LSVDITDRVATVTAPDPDWKGLETIWFKACDPGGLCDSNQASFTVFASDVDDEDSIQSQISSFRLNQNHPNPFNLSTSITYDLPTSSRVKLTIYDLSGRRVKTLADESQPTGSKIIDWDGTNDKGSTVASGIYFYRLEVISVTDDNVARIAETKKMLLLK
jgi:hypothetical protein